MTSQGAPEAGAWKRTREKFELWFFRDILDDHRLALFRLFGMPVGEIKSLGEQRHCIKPLLDALAASPSPPPGVGEEPFEALPWVVRIGEVLDEGDGFWRSCSSCHELNDGAPTGDYSAAFRTHVGLGCSECGGLGVVWDDTDYDAMAADLAAPSNPKESSS